MTTNQVFLLFACILVAVFAVGQAAHVTPTGRLRDGFRVLLLQALTAVVQGIKLTRRAIFDSVWVMETAKNLFQAVLLSGAGFVGFLLASQTEADKLATPANVGGFIVFGGLMALVTRRAEQLRDAQAEADAARRRSELVAALVAALTQDDARRTAELAAALAAALKKD